MELRRAKKRSLVLNVTSLIDVLFLLLIFFMISTTFLSQPAIKLELPEAANAEPVRQTPLVVNVAADGRVFLNDDPIEINLLQEALRQQLEGDDDRAVVLKADEAVSHGQVVRVMDVVKGAGARRLTVSTRPSN